MNNHNNVTINAPTSRATKQYEVMSRSKGRNDSNTRIVGDFNYHTFNNGQTIHTENIGLNYSSDQIDVHRIFHTTAE